MPKNDPIILPEKYYLDYFNYVLEFVERQYDHILDKPEHLFYQSFRDLSEQAQCLYLRLSNRRGRFFRINKISYPEIPDLSDAKEELVSQGFIQINESDDLSQFDLFTKNELASFFGFLASKRKSEMLQELTPVDLNVLHTREEIVEVLKNEEVDFIKLLFFGRVGGQMTDFVVRDVGHVKIEKLDESKFKPWFQTREEALAVMHLYQLRRMIHEIQDAGLPIVEYLDQMPWEVWLSLPRASKPTTKLLLKLAYQFEQQQEPELALQYYTYVDAPPSRERRVRILEKLNRKEEANNLAQAMYSKPANATEKTFAQDFLNRKGIRISRSMTERLKSSPVITLERNNSNVEKAVLQHFEQNGWQGIHAENFLWRGLFGLVFWEVIFDTDHGAFHHPLQRQPSDLTDHTFFKTREPKIKSLLNSLKTKEQLRQHVSSIYEQKEGLTNRFVTWHESLQPTIDILIDKIKLSSLKQVLTEMAKNMKENSAGFPDLFLWNDEAYYFYEVKSPNDQLSAQQLFWLDFLSSHGIQVDVLRVQYEDDSKNT